MIRADGFSSAGWPGLSTLALWAGAASLAIFLAMLFTDSAVFGGVYVPQGNDSFYHARRALDALGSRGFYETDLRVHAPDGRVVPWPWAYDYMLAAIARVALWLNPGGDPLAVLFYVPVAFILINAALFVAAAGALRLSFEMRAVAVICFALSPLTQLLHGFGMLDHHYIEHTFVLLQVWLGLQWFRDPGNLRWSAALGVALGIAPAFHTGLFVLQIAPLACVFALWLRRREPPRSALIAFAVALVAAMLLVLLPSATFRGGYFEFGLLSWFHLYVAACTAATMLFIAWQRRSSRSLLGLMILALVMAAPGAGQLAGGATFISGGVSTLSEVHEAQSVYAQATRTLGPFLTASLYSWLWVLAPVLLLWNAHSLATAREPDKLFYAIACAFGLFLLLAQFRFHYFGFFALVTGGLVVVDRLRERFGWHRGGVFAATLGVVVLAYQPALRARLFQLPPPGMDPEYGNSQPLYLRLAMECATDPGVVLANANDGNPILFHTDCSIITNNMIVSSADDEHLRRAGRLFRMRPEEIRRVAPEVRYLLVRTTDFSPVVNGQPRLLTDNPVVAQLLLAEEPPSGFTALQTVYFAGVGGPGAIYARLYKIAPATPN
jgi:asparagine N-glycosylation enzyme membrane subunit Stt3